MDDMHDWISLHLACIANAPVEVVRYLANEKRSSVHKKDNRGYTPLMYVLKEKQDVNVIECVCFLQYEFMGDYNSDDDDIVIGRTMFSLEHDDPYLERLSLGSTTTIGGSSEMLRVVDATLCHSTIKSLYSVWDDVDSLL
jgi:ankyrin repeat protein